MLKKTLKAWLMAFAAMLLAFNAHAQAYPNKPIKVITPLPAGSGPDVLLRMVAEQVTAELGQAMIIDNRPGGGGFIAFDAAKRAPNDGYTLVHMDSFHIGTHPHLFSKLPYDAFKDFTPITPLIRNYFFIVVPTDSRFQTMGDLIAAAKAAPGRITYGSWGVATPGHLGGLMLEAATGTHMVHVPFKESAVLYLSVAAGDVDWAIATPGSAAAVLQSGKARLLAVCAPRRVPGYEKVPTVAESGGPANYEVSGWNGLLAPAGTPPGIVQKLNQAVVKAMQSPKVKEKLAFFTYEDYTMPPAQMGRLMRKEVANWEAPIKGANIKLD